MRLAINLDVDNWINLINSKIVRPLHAKRYTGENVKTAGAPT